MSAPEPALPMLTIKQLRDVKVKLCREVGVQINNNAVPVILMGLAVPVRVTSVTEDEAAAKTKISFEVEGRFGRASVDHHFPTTGELTRTDSDLKTLLEPAMALRAADPADRVPVSVAVKNAWALENMPETLIEIRREWMDSGVHVPSLEHLTMMNGVSLEAWLSRSAATNEDLAALAVKINELGRGLRRKCVEILDSVEELETLVHRHKRATLNPWRRV